MIFVTLGCLGLFVIGLVVLAALFLALGLLLYGLVETLRHKMDSIDDKNDIWRK